MSERGPSILCDACQMRKVVRPPLTDDAPASIRIHPALWKVMRTFASEFDRSAEEEGLLFTADEFLVWLEPSVIGSVRHGNVTEMLAGRSGGGEAA